MVLINSTDVYSSSKYIVGTGSPYATVQSAIDAANAAGDLTTVLVRDGTYTENLTLYDGIDIQGVGPSVAMISGVHTPPESGLLHFSNILLHSTSNILSSLAGGTTDIRFDNCTFSCDNGYVCDLRNWTGDLIFNACSDTSTINGVVYNTSTADVEITNCTIGASTTKIFTAKGNVKIFATDFFAPMSLSGSGTSKIQGGSIIHGNITTADTHTLVIGISGISSGAVQAITHNSTSELLMNNVVINSTNSPAIGGTGTISINSVSFLNDYDIAGTITDDPTGVTRNEQMLAENIIDLNETGFQEWDSAGPYYDDTTLGTFSLLVGGFGYIKNERIEWSAPQSVTGMVAGVTYYIYIDSDGTLQKTSTYSTTLFEENIVLFECMRDSTAPTNNQLTVKENHPYSFSVATSNYLHATVGTVIENLNNGANITLNGTQKIQIDTTDYLSDHGLYTTITDSAGVAVTWLQYYTDGTGKWALYTSSDTFTGYYNNAGTPTALGVSKFAVYRLYVSKDDLNSSTPTYFAILDTQQYNNIGAAQTAVANGTPASPSSELNALELCQLGYIIYSQSSSSIVEVTISKSTLRSAISTGGSSVASGVSVDTSTFNGWLSAADTTVQAALNTLDDIVITVDGDSGSASGRTISIKSDLASFECGASVKFTASGSAISLDVSDTANNVYLGRLAGGATGVNTGGNVGVGYKALGSLNGSGGPGSWNTGIGTEALAATTNTSSTTAVGSYSCATGNPGNENTCIGAFSGNTSPTGANNTAVGRSSFANGCSGTENCAFGWRSSYNAVLSGSYNTSIGSASLYYGGASSYNTVVGARAMAQAMTGGSNTVVGAYAMTNGSATTGSTAMGYYALSTASPGQYNTAIGYYACKGSTTGQYNTTLGYYTGQAGLTGSANVAIGKQTMGTGVISGSNNIAIGENSMYSAVSSSNNIGIGKSTFLGALSGDYNIAIGETALTQVTSGAYNICIGQAAGTSLATGGESHNIYINSTGANAESNALRIGAATGTGTKQLNSAFICGINGINVAGSAVLVSASDQLGINTSSIRYKDDVVDMDSSKLLDLRPVNFVYKGDDTKHKQYGLIAEEVSEIMPELVVYDKEGLPQTVMYHVLPAILLNEIKKLKKEVEELKAALAK